MIRKTNLVALMILSIIPLTGQGQSVPAKTEQRAQNAPAVQKARSVADSIPDTVVGKYTRKTFNARRVHANQAEAILRRVGATTDKEIVAILANAWHECSWDPREVSGSNVGFFQLNSHGMGHGMSVQSRQNLKTNVSVLTNSTSFKAWLAWCKKHPGATAGEMSYRFASKVEACASRHRAPRRVTADRWYRAMTLRG